MHGCLGYLMKTADTDTLVEAIKSVYAGKEFFETPLKAEVKENHRYNLQTKLRVKSMAELIRVALQAGWV